MLLIPALLCAAVASTKVQVTFHDGIQVPHARAATDERQYINNIRPADSIIRGQTVQTQPVFIPQIVRSDDTIPTSVVQELSDSALERLKERNKAFYKGLKDSDDRDVSFRYYNELREADGLEPRSYEEIVAEKKRRKKQKKLRKAIVQMEKGKTISSQAHELLKELKETQPVAYNSIKIRLKVRKEINALYQKRIPLTRREIIRLESLSQQYARILKGHRKYFS